MRGRALGYRAAGKRHDAHTEVCGTHADKNLGKGGDPRKGDGTLHAHTR